jgi:hypothetical protein
LASVVPVLSRTDPDQAQALLGEISSANTRSQVEEQIERINAVR